MVVQNPHGVYFNSASNFSALRIGGTLFLESGNLYVDSNPAARSIRLSGPLNANGHQLVFAGNQCDLIIEGSGMFGLVPVNSDQTFRSLTINRTGESVMFDQNVSVTGNVTVGGGSLILNENITIHQLTMTGGELNLNQNTILTGASIISGGILSFENIALTVQSQLDVAGGFLKSNENSDLIFNGTGIIGNLSFTPQSLLRSLYLDRLQGGVLGTITNRLRVNETVNLVNGMLRNDGVFELAENATITTSNISGVMGNPLTGGPYHVVYTGTANISPTGAELPLNSPIASLTSMSSASVLLGSDVEVLGDLQISSGTMNFNGQSVTCSNIQNEGTVVGGGGTIRVTGDVINNGVFHAPTSIGLFQLAGDFENNGSFNQIGGTIELLGSTQFTGNAPDFRNVIVTGEFFAPPEFSVRGDFTNNGIFHHQNSLITFSGTTVASQEIKGSATTTFNDVFISNVTAFPGVIVESLVQISGVLSMDANTSMDPDGIGDNSVLTLLSSTDNPTRDAAIAPLPARAAILGDITLQRYMSIEGTNNNRIYRYLASPITNATVADLQNEIPVTGNFDGSSSCLGCSTTPSMFGYNETITTDLDGNGITDLNDGYQAFPINNNDEQLEVAKGYAVFVRGNILATPVWDVRGVINRGEIEFPVSFSASGNVDNDGWNLVGNPFPSAIDFDASNGWNKTNIDAAIYFRDNGNIPERFATWNGEVGTNGGSGIIPIGQGFWVKASGPNPELKADENVKTPGVASTFFREEDIPNTLRIQLKAGDAMDETIVYFRAGASPDFDSKFDAHKLKNNSVNVASYSDSKYPLAINALAPLQCEANVKLLISELPVGNHQLNFEGLESFPDDVAIRLLDRYSGNEIDLKNNGSVSFAVEDSSESMAIDRFAIHFNTMLETPTVEWFDSLVCQDTPAELHIEGNEDFTYSVFQDSLALNSKTTITHDTDIIFSTEQLQVGKNMLRLEVSAPTCRSFFSIPFELQLVPIPKIDTVFTESSCGPGTVMLSARSWDTDYLNWYDCLACEIPIQQDVSTLQIALEESQTFYVEPVTIYGCIGAREPVEATVIQFIPTEIRIKGDCLISNYTTEKQWYFMDSLIDTAQSILPLQSGVYSLRVQIDQCISADSINFNVDKKEAFIVFPNPVADQLTISSTTISGELVEVVLFDLRGKEVLYGSGYSTLNLDMTHIASGYYWLLIRSKNASERAIIQRQ